MKKVSFSIRIIYILTSIIYYLAVLFCALGIIVSIALLFGFFHDEILLHVAVPMKVNIEEVGILQLFGQEMKVEIFKTINGQIHFIDTPPVLLRVYAILTLVCSSILFWVVYLFHRFIRNVREGKAFEIINFKILRKLGYSLLGFWLFMIFYFKLINYTLANNIEFENIEVINDRKWFIGIFLGALFTLVLSQVFLKGRELEEENELTI